MDIQKAKELLKMLADGVNPLTGEILPDEDSCNQVEIVRALNTAVTELDKLTEKNRGLSRKTQVNLGQKKRTSNLSMNFSVETPQMR